jgi:hypothetical protein
MEISFVLDWTSFWIGAVSTVLLTFVTAFVLAGLQLRKQKRKGSRRI